MDAVTAGVEGRDGIQLQAVLAAQPCVAVTASAGLTGHIRGEHRRVRLAGTENAMFAMAIGAYRDAAMSARERDTVHAFLIASEHFLVALSASRRDVGARGRRVG